MSAADHYSKANEAFVEDNFEEALKEYTRAIEKDGERHEYFSSRSHAHTKLENYHEALADATKAIKLLPNNPKAYLRKGIANFHLENYELAKEDFQQGRCLDENDSNFAKWTTKCDGELELRRKATSEDGSETSVATDTEPTTVTPETSNTPVISDTPAAASNEGSGTSTENTAAPEPGVIVPPAPKTRYDWYQTETQVVVTILAKNVKKEDVQVDIQPQSLSVDMKLSSGADYCLSLDLCHSVTPEKSVTKVLSTKVEIKMLKTEGVRWDTLEAAPDAPQLKHIPAGASAGSDTHKYPTSRHVTHDWDHLVAEIKREEKDEKLEGDAALNKLFSQIYSDGSDEVKRAMNKSFVQSGGTVLSTNWSEVGARQMDIKPPDGMEFKKWDQ